MRQSFFIFKTTNNDLHIMIAI